MNISTCMGVKDGLELNKNAYAMFRKVYPTEELCISSGGSTDGTKAWLESLNDPNLRWSHVDEPLTFGGNFNRAISLATKEKIVVLHSDMIVAPGFLERLDKNENPMMVLGYTTYEPPIFEGHQRPGKVIKDFGRGFADFNYEGFYTEAASVLAKPETQEPGVFSFLSLYKKTYDAIKGQDGGTFRPNWLEDEDLNLRLILHGCDFLTISHAIVFHFVSQTIRFSEPWKDIAHPNERKSTVNFIRKWGSRYAPFVMPAPVRYDMGVELTATHIDQIRPIEPYFNNMVIKGVTLTDADKHDILTGSTNHTVNKFVNEITNDINVEIDMTQFNENDMRNLNMLQLIIKKANTIGSFRLGNLMIHIKQLTERQNSLIVNPAYYGVEVLI